MQAWLECWKCVTILLAFAHMSLTVRWLKIESSMQSCSMWIKQWTLSNSARRDASAMLEAPSRSSIWFLQGSIDHSSSIKWNAASIKGPVCLPGKWLTLSIALLLLKLPSNQCPVNEMKDSFECEHVQRSDVIEMNFALYNSLAMEDLTPSYSFGSASCVKYFLLGIK